jgi:hypothetical protein
MPSLPIVKHLDIFKNVRLSLGTSLVMPSLNPFRFERMKKAFDDGIVPTVSLPAHATPDAMLRQQGLKFLAGILATPVGMVQKTTRRGGNAAMATHMAGTRRTGTETVSRHIILPPPAKRCGGIGRAPAPLRQ